MRIFILFFFFSFVISTSHASQAPYQPVCEVKGVVQSLSLRKEEGKGLSHGRTLKYIDVDFKLVASDRAEDLMGAEDPCAMRGGDVQVFQIAPDFLGLMSPKLPKAGQCIKAELHHVADGNFHTGRYLLNIINLDLSECE